MEKTEILLQLLRDSIILETAKRDLKRMQAKSRAKRRQINAILKRNTQHVATIGVY